VSGPSVDLRRTVAARFAAPDDVPSRMEPGDLYPERASADGDVVGYVYACVGCGSISGLHLHGRVGEGPRWRVESGDPGRPSSLTLAPSILHDPAKGGCGWHGWLREGHFVPC
jgi:hypothetical protein